MELIKKENADFYQGDGYSGMDYPSRDKEINFAVIKISSRSPKSGFQLNTECKELLYILSGDGTIYTEDGVESRFYKGDVIVIEKNESYAFDGKFEAAVSCTPAWTSAQHKYTE